MAGKRQKTSGELQGYGSAHRGEATLTLVPPDARREVPDPPKGLPEGLHAVWASFWASRISTLVEPADAYDVGRYFLLLAEREKHERAIRAKPLVEGSMGQQVPNPRLMIVKELTREIEKTREQLGILSLARLRLNIAENVERNGIADLRRKLDGGGAQREPIEAEATAVVDLDALG